MGGRASTFARSAARFPRRDTEDFPDRVHLHARRAEAAGTSGCRVDDGDLDETGALDALHDELGDALAARDLERRLAKVCEQHHHLAAKPWPSALSRRFHIAEAPVEWRGITAGPHKCATGRQLHAHICYSISGRLSLMPNECSLTATG